MPILLSAKKLSPSSGDWTTAQKIVRWGWKRDRARESRIVYFQAELINKGGCLFCADPVFFYKHRSYRDDIAIISNTLKSVTETSRFECYAKTERNDNWFHTVRLTLGTLQKLDTRLLRRLLVRRPRRVWPKGEFPPEYKGNPANFFPAVVYFGSGLSYEAGLPTLCDVHADFCLDDDVGDGFTFGRRDRLPSRLKESLEGTFRTFCRTHVEAIFANPTLAMRTLGELHRRGAVEAFYSDNVENLFAKVGAPFTRTRGSGVLNERFPLPSHRCSTLIVIGVAADRRQLIRQARRHGMRIVVVNPVATVSHGVQHLNYVKSSDVFVRSTAEEWARAINKELW